MNDDWRLQVDLDDLRHASPLVERLDARELEHDLSGAFHDRVVVSRDDARVFLYAGTRDQIEAARELVVSLAKDHDWKLSTELKRWHPVAEEWEDPDRPLPQDEAAKAAERGQLMTAERRQTEQRGYPEFEVRVDLPSRHDALRFAERLRDEDSPVVRRWKFLLVGAEDEDQANSLAARIRDEAPFGSHVSVEGTWRAAYAERLPNPFAVLGGLGG
jgi:hypothetical protein